MKEILVEVSARHVHVTQETLEKLFGEGYQLTVKKELSQPGQFASNEKVTVRGPKGELKMSILGPCRKLNQIECSLTDARTIGVEAMIRESGDVAGTKGCVLVGPAGEVELSEGVIAAKRHIHMTEADAEEFGVKNGEIVSVEVDSGKGRKCVFGDTVVRVSNSYALAMHIDTDEGNAACMAGSVMGKLVK